MDIILVILLVCGQPDTVIVKAPNKQSIYTHNLKDPKTLESIANILAQEPTIIQYEEDRGRCA